MSTSPVPTSLFRPGRAAAALLALVAVVGVLLFVAWPVGVVVGLATCTAAVLVVGRRMQAEWSEAEPDVLPASLTGETAEAEAEVDAPAPVRPELQALKERLDDGNPDFARAARLVVTTQYASAARLQRELQVPYSRARRLLDDLESHRVVGPPTGPRPRRVLLSREDVAGLERLLAEA